MSPQQIFSQLLKHEIPLPSNVSTPIPSFQEGDSLRTKLLILRKKKIFCSKLQDVQLPPSKLQNRQTQIFTELVALPLEVTEVEVDFL